MNVVVPAEISSRDFTSLQSAMEIRIVYSRQLQFSEDITRCNSIIYTYEIPSWILLLIIRTRDCLEFFIRSKGKERERKGSLRQAASSVADRDECGGYSGNNKSHLNARAGRISAAFLTNETTSCSTRYNEHVISIYSSCARAFTSIGESDPSRN